jgi:hypothetical protein
MPQNLILCLVVLSLAGAATREEEQGLAADFTAGTGGWTQQVRPARRVRSAAPHAHTGIAQVHVRTSAGIEGFRPTATALRVLCTKREISSPSVCGVEGEDSGGRDSGVQGRTVSATAKLQIAPLDPSDSSTGFESWYFVAPPTWSGDLSWAYGGTFTVQLEHTEIPPAARRYDAPDIVITARCGHILSAHLDLQRARAAGGQAVPLREAAWVDSRTGAAPTRLALLGTLAHVRDVKVRGGFMFGFESTRLLAAALAPGDAPLFPCCALDGAVGACLTRPSPYATPPRSPPDPPPHLLPKPFTSPVLLLHLLPGVPPSSLPY